MKRILVSAFMILLLFSLFYGCGKMPDERLMEEGKALENEELFEEAAVKYDAVLEFHAQSPFGAEALYSAGVLYLNELEYISKAFDRFQKIVDSYPESEYEIKAKSMIDTIYQNFTPEIILEKGKVAEEKEQFDKAAGYYEAINKMFPESEYCSETLYRSALVTSNGLKDYPKAIDTFKSIINQYPDSKYAPQSQFMIGFIYANDAPDTTKARQAYLTFLKEYPEHELIPSVEWELKYLGKDINQIPELMSLEPKE